MGVAAGPVNPPQHALPCAGPGRIERGIDKERGRRYSLCCMANWMHATNLLVGDVVATGAPEGTAC